MTVVVAALSQGNKGGVLAADQMLSLAGGAQGKVPKITKLFGRVLVAFAGDYAQASGVLDKVQRREAEFAKATVGEIAVAVEAERKVLAIGLGENRRIEVDDALRLIGSHPGLSDGTLPHATELLEEAARKILQLSLNVEFLIMGRDPDGIVRLYTVEGVGLNCGWNGIGFAAIGSGGFYAMVGLGRWQTSQNLAQTVYKVYEAKKAAEGGAGVGVETDMAVFREGEEATFLSAQDIDDLGKVHLEVMSTAKTLTEKEMAAVREVIARLGKSNPPTPPDATTPPQH